MGRHAAGPVGAPELPADHKRVAHTPQRQPLEPEERRPKGTHPLQALLRVERPAHCGVGVHLQRLQARANAHGSRATRAVDFGRAQPLRLCVVLYRPPPVTAQRCYEAAQTRLRA